MLRIIVALCLSLAALESNAQLYKWVDSEGNTHYSDVKPKGQSAEDISAKLPSTNVDSSHEKLQALDVIRQQRLQDQQKKQQQLQNQVKQRQQACSQARRYLSRVRGRSYFRYGDGGQKTSEADRKKMQAQAQARVDRLCK
ncbi:DUF4124 domain-containing protein [uncultured Pseudoteredinibacter sp.]|uniref:DUF4124 domain-containing protein n=1 Tax=uncultured Pseudoteredinibacter sp. TaxID=1641701 RepID=UPI002617C913|nr:DUF4124 domain-containing protein [uncultured Pseudoteredinibacter sp.]